MDQLKRLYDRGVPVPPGSLRGSRITIAVEDFSYALYRIGKNYYILGPSGQIVRVTLAGIIYIAGPMRGYDKHNMPAFDAAAKHFSDLGYYVFNPADMDRENGIDENTPDSAVTVEMLRVCMRRDLDAITVCSHIALLRGWESSSGVRPEASLANLLEQTFLIQSYTPDFPAFQMAPRSYVMAVIGAHYIGRY